MPYADFEKRKATRKAYYYATIDERRRYNREQKRERQATNYAYIKDYKSKHPCPRCGEADPACLDFHHRDPKLDDNDTVTRHAANGVSIKRLEQEIARCEVLCSNCHRKLHAYELKVETTPRIV